MNTIETIFLGIVQGLTEFLPVSSSGHLVIFQNILGFKEPELLLDCALHLGTLSAVCVYFRSELRSMLVEMGHFLLQRRRKQMGPSSMEIGDHALLLWWVLIGSIPTAFIGLTFKAPLERLFASVHMAGAMLMATGVIVFSTRLLRKKRSGRRNVGLLIALAIGTAQGLAIIPGISRSGATIVCGLMCGLERDMAGRFSFLLSIPAIMGAVFLQLSTEAAQRVGLLPLLLGFVSAALVGLLALRFLMAVVRKGHLYYFAPYCWALGLGVFLAAR